MWNRARLERWEKPLLRAGSRERKRRIDPPKAVQIDILSMPTKPLTRIKKMSKMKGGPNKSMKTKGQISDKMLEATKYLKTKWLHKIAD